jgi:hypothetical protein
MQSTAVQRNSDTSQLDANIAALRSKQPVAAELVSAAQSPFALMPATGRDLTPTYCWTDADSRQHWFGRTTMPLIRGEALIESFQPGTGNVLLHGIGHGIESLLLLIKLGAHQAVAVVEPDAWHVRAALALTDLSRYIESRQLLLFPGPTSWKDAADFLAENAGYLVPTRILSWPWFEKEDVAHVTDQLRSLQSDVSSRRVAMLASIDMPAPAARDNAIAIFSSHADPRSLRLCRRVAAGLRALGLESLCLAPDSPALMLTSAVQRKIAEFAPGSMLFVNAMPDDLPALPPECRNAVIAGPYWSPTELSLANLPATARLFALSTGSRDYLVAKGLSADRIVCIADAALPSLPIHQTGREILILADRLEIAPESVGLHLTSHVRLWNEAKNQILNQIDTYHDAKADAVLTAAEKKLGYALDSAEVRTGLTDRIRNVLGAELVRRAYIEALINADIPFTVTGRGWGARGGASHNNQNPPRKWGAERDKAISAHPERQSSSADPSIRTLDAWTIETAPTALNRYGAVISLNSNNNTLDEFLDTLSTGMIGYIRIPTGDSINLNLAEIFDPKSDLQTFTNRASFIKVINQFLADPEKTKSRFAHTAEKIRTQHTWSARLRQILAQIGHALPAESNT